MERKIYFRIDETRVKCEYCREIVSSDNTVLKSELVNALEERVSFLRTENILLRKIIEEKGEKCKFIIEVKNLQEDKITYLQENKKYQYKNNETKKVKQSIPKAVNKPKIAAECQGTTHSQSEEEEEEVDKRQSEMSVVTVTEEKENTENNEGDDNDNFKQVKNRRRQPQTKNRNQSKYIGCNEEISEFTGAQPKVWLYLYRVKRDVNECNIKKFITEKLYPDTLRGEENNNQNVIVRELNTDPNRLKCFMVGADMVHKNNLYDLGFWPEGVGFRRFDFARHRQYEGRSRDNQNSFL
ncbi:hypothetical protein JTB14_007244 [Gonioctena quinquepunctata]|nr:hypothetical protein JTB14_007244 [Gonioctena quinquepunctata]